MERWQEDRGTSLRHRGWTEVAHARYDVRPGLTRVALLERSRQ